MNTNKSVFLNKELRCGGFFELCIQLPLRDEVDVMGTYKEHLWNHKNIDGPYDPAFNPIDWNADEYREEGMMHIGEKHIPFKTHCMKEDSPSGIQWFEISIYTATAEHFFTTVEGPEKEVEIPKALYDFLSELMRGLFNVHPFDLAYISYENAQDVRLEQLQKEGLKNPFALHFFVSKENFLNILPVYYKMVTAL